MTVIRRGGRAYGVSHLFPTWHTSSRIRFQPFFAQLAGVSYIFTFLLPAKPAEET
jgi:hypothetical protein